MATNYISIDYLQSHKTGGYIINNQAKIDILIFYENYKVKRITHVKEAEISKMLSENKSVRHLMEDEISRELNESKYSSYGKWKFDKLKNEIRIDFIPEGEFNVVMKCKICESANLHVNMFKCIDERIYEKELSEYKYDLDLKWWLLSNMLYQKNGKMVKYKFY